MKLEIFPSLVRGLLSVPYSTFVLHSLHSYYMYHILYAYVVHCHVMSTQNVHRLFVSCLYVQYHYLIYNMSCFLIIIFNNLFQILINSPLTFLSFDILIHNAYYLEFFKNTFLSFSNQYIIFHVLTCMLCANA